MTEPSLTICDLSPLYCEKGGGIRTFHQARIEWFRRQTRHRYVLISPGPSFSMSRIARTVLHVRVFGLQMTRDSGGYRLMLDYGALQSAIETMRPDVVEVHEPWLSLPFMQWLRHRGVFGGLLTSFWHGDPIATYVEPFLRRWRIGSRVRRSVVGHGQHLLRAIHHVCDSTFVASDWMQRQLADAGVRRVVKVGFGVDAELLAMRRSRFGVRRGTRLLYVGRLDDDKEFRMILDALPALLRRSDVMITVIGTGKYQKQLAALAHPRLRTIGFVGDRAAIRAAYAAHDVLLAPGRFETFGLSALEAAAAGLVVVGPDAGGTSELLRQMESPLIFPAGDRDLFMSRVEAALDSAWSQLAARGRAVAAQYGSWDDAVARQVALYESMAGDHAEAHRRSA